MKVSMLKLFSRIQSWWRRVWCRLGFHQWDYRVGFPGPVGGYWSATMAIQQPFVYRQCCCGRQEKWIDAKWRRVTLRFGENDD